MNILLTNVYSFQNKGDAAIVIALLHELKRVFPHPNIAIQTTDVKNDLDKYGVPVSSTLLWQFLSSVRDRSVALRMAVAARGIVTLMLFLLAYRATGARLHFLLTKELRQFVHENMVADFVVGCGGGYLRTSNGSAHDTLLLLVTCLNFVTAAYLGKPVFMYSQSIGPVYGRVQKALLKWALNKVQLVESREDVSTRFLESLNLSVPVVATADSALLLGGHGKLPEGILHANDGRMRVGLTVRKWFKTPSELEAYIATMAQAIDYVVEKYNAEVYYIPQVIAEKFGDDDRLIAQRVHEKVRNRDYFTVIDSDLHPFEVIGLCAAMNVFIGTRMHSNIFALISHVPVVAIEYEHKTRGIMRGLGIESLTLDIHTLSLDTLKAKIDDVIAHRSEYSQLIQTNLVGQIKKSQSAMEIIKEVYETKAQGVQ
ncbi:MAG TPA: polysaccharide pyruvyl transferase family protein [Candidatus Saccharimonadales bacterium]|nr:polysaccharide pyruvyl transferase family protein [Candidatus Saccharimonadales bacterium]